MSLLGHPAERTGLSYLAGMRGRTDLGIDREWLVVVLVNYVVWVSLPILYFIVSSIAPPLAVKVAGVVGLLGAVTSLGVAYLVYSLVNVRNQHFAREQALLVEGLGLVRSKAPRDDLGVLLPLDSAGQNLQILVHEEKEKSAVLIGLLALIPYLGLLVLIFILAVLSRDLPEHEIREEMILDDLDRGMRELSLTPMIRRSVFVSRRPVAGFVVASMLTLGVFSLIWLYLEISDVRPHFEYHARFETDLLLTLSRGPAN